MANVLATLPAVAVSVADCVEATAATVAEKLAEVAPAGTVTELGTATAASLLPRATTRPPVGAAAVSDTEQESVPADAYELVAQLIALSAAVEVAPVPLRLTVAVLPAAALLVMVNCPLALPDVAGSKFTVRVVLCPGFSVAGRLALARVNPVPVIAASLTVTAAVPVEVRVTVWVAVVFTATLPNARFRALTLRADVIASSCNSKDCWPSAPSVAAWVAVTAVAVAVKVAVVAPAATVTLAGTVTAALLLVRVTVCPPVAAAPARVTVQASVPAPVNCAFAQVRPLTGWGCAAADAPMPLRSTTVALPVVELLLTVN
jgi:hypothetical protein